MRLINISKWLEDIDPDHPITDALKKELVDVDFDHQATEEMKEEPVGKKGL